MVLRGMEQTALVEQGHGRPAYSPASGDREDDARLRRRFHHGQDRRPHGHGRTSSRRALDLYAKTRSAQPAERLLRLDRRVDRVDVSGLASDFLLCLRRIKRREDRLAAVEAVARSLGKQAMAAGAELLAAVDGKEEVGPRVGGLGTDQLDGVQQLIDLAAD